MDLPSKLGTRLCLVVSRAADVTSVSLTVIFLFQRTMFAISYTLASQKGEASGHLAKLVVSTRPGVVGGGPREPSLSRRRGTPRHGQDTGLNI